MSVKPKKSLRICPDERTLLGPDQKLERKSSPVLASGFEQFSRKSMDDSGFRFRKSARQPSRKPRRKSYMDAFHCECGPDFYNAVLGPTADEAILRGIRTVTNICRKFMDCDDDEEESHHDLPVKSGSLLLEKSAVEVVSEILEAVGIPKEMASAIIQTSFYELEKSAPELVSRIMQTSTPQMVSQILQTLGLSKQLSSQVIEESIGTIRHDPSMASAWMQTSMPELRSGMMQTTPPPSLMSVWNQTSDHMILEPSRSRQPSYTSQVYEPSSMSQPTAPSSMSHAYEPSRITQPSEHSRMSQAYEPSRMTQDNESSRMSQAYEPSRTTQASRYSDVSQAGEPSHTSQASEPSRMSQAYEPSRTSQASRCSHVSQASEPSRASQAYEPSRTSQASKCSHVSQASEPSRTSQASRCSHISHLSEGGERSRVSQADGASCVSQPCGDLKGPSVARMSSEMRQKRKMCVCCKCVVKEDEERDVLVDESTCSVAERIREQEEILKNEGPVRVRICKCLEYSTPSRVIVCPRKSGDSKNGSRTVTKCICRSSGLRRSKHTYSKGDDLCAKECRCGCDTSRR